MNYFRVTFEWNNWTQTETFMVYNVMDALEAWGKSHNHFYGSIIKIEKI